jgi:hypothetical protein
VRQSPENDTFSYQRHAHDAWTRLQTEASSASSQIFSTVVEIAAAITASEPKRVVLRGEDSSDMRRIRDSCSVIRAVVLAHSRFIRIAPEETATALTDQGQKRLPGSVVICCRQGRDEDSTGQPTTTLSADRRIASSIETTVMPPKKEDRKALKWCTRPGELWGGLISHGSQPESS